MARITPLKKKVALAAASALALLLFIEVAGRIYYFQRKSERSTFVGLLAKWVGDRRAEAEARKFAEKMGRPAPRSAAEPFKADPSKYTLTRPQVEELYEKIFGEFVKACRERGAALVVLHAPDPYTPKEDRDFFAAVCKRHEIQFVDLTEWFTAFPDAATHLLPLDAHLTMFGHMLAAKALAEALPPLLSHRAPQCAEEFPERLGDLEPHERKLHGGAKIPYWETIGAHGLRGSVVYPREKTAAKPRILCVGDSYTHGPYVDDATCYPYRLQQMLPETEVINAGVEGYTICDELTYFLRRGARLSPDIVILQVLTNDLYGLQPEWRRAMCRHNRIPSEPPGEFCYKE